MQTDTELLQIYKEGDLSGLESLVKRHQDAVYGYALCTVKDEGAAGDIAQEVFMKLVENPEAFKEGNFKAWLYTVARNKCTDYFRKNSKSAFSLDLENEEGLSLGDMVASEELTPLENLLKAENSVRINEVFESIPADQREVIYMRQDMSFKEIAAVLECPIGTVLARASRGYKKIKDRLEEQYAGK